MTNSAFQSSLWTFIHNAFFIYRRHNNVFYIQAHCLIGAQYLTTIASNEISFDELVYFI